MGLGAFGAFISLLIPIIGIALVIWIIVMIMQIRDSLRNIEQKLSSGSSGAIKAEHTYQPASNPETGNPAGQPGATQERRYQQ